MEEENKVSGYGFNRGTRVDKADCRWEVNYTDPEGGALKTVTGALRVGVAKSESKTSILFDVRLKSFAKNMAAAGFSEARISRLGESITNSVLEDVEDGVLGRLPSTEVEVPE